jgi:septal ring factor EnvC (AmiA/AmiB activator)
MYEGDSIWSRKGATFSDKSARLEFGLTQQEIIAAIREGKLQFQQNSMHGNPWFRLLRHEVEALVTAKSGKDQLHRKKLEKELADINKEARKLKTRLKAIERRRAELTKELTCSLNSEQSGVARKREQK